MKVWEICDTTYENGYQYGKEVLARYTSFEEAKKFFDEYKRTRIVEHAVFGKNVEDDEVKLANGDTKYMVYYDDGNCRTYILSLFSTNIKFYDKFDKSQLDSIF